MSTAQPYACWEKPVPFVTGRQLNDAVMLCVSNQSLGRIGCQRRASVILLMGKSCRNSRRNTHSTSSATRSCRISGPACVRPSNPS
jgi:hypothetical protein